MQWRHRNWLGFKTSPEKLADQATDFIKKSRKIEITRARREFLEGTKADFQNISQVALAAEVIQSYPHEAKNLWKVKGQGWEGKLREKLLNFMKNSRV